MSGSGDRDEALAAAALERRFVLGDEVHTYAPPTVRQAVEALGALAALTGDDEDEAEHFFGQVGSWLPGPVMEWYRQAGFLEQARFLHHALFAGADMGERKDKGEEGGEEKAPASDTDWIDLLAAYVGVYGGEPWRVFDTVPFPFFLTLVVRVDRQLARQHLYQAEMVLLPHLGKEGDKVLGRIRTRAGFSSALLGGDSEEDFVAEARRWRDAQNAMEAENG